MDERQAAGENPGGQGHGSGANAATPSLVHVDELPEQQEYDQGNRQAEQQAALSDEQCRNGIAPAERAISGDRVVAGHRSEDADQATFACPGVLEQEQPPEAATEKHERRCDVAGKPIRGQNAGETVDQADQRQPEQQILDEERLTHRSSERD